MAESCTSTHGEYHGYTTPKKTTTDLLDAAGDWGQRKKKKKDDGSTQTPTPATPKDE